MWWRWRESNPRPLTGNQDFSGCSALRSFSAPGLARTRPLTGPVEKESRASSRHRYAARSLDDAGDYAEIMHRPTDFGLAQAARAKSVRLELAPIGVHRTLTS